MKKNKSLLGKINLLRLMEYTLLFSTVTSLAIYLWIAYYRLQYPFELEWIEGGVVDQVQRIVHGGSIYVAPGINFVPFLYPPLYFYLSAAASLIFGGGFFPLRLVSFVASLVTFASIFLIVRATTKNGWAALLALGLFASTFRVTGAWLDIARVDSLFLALWLLFVYMVISKEKSLFHAILAGGLAALAFLTKQTALILCLPILAYFVWRNWKYALSLIVTFALIVGITTLIFNLASGGWYTYYVFDLLSQQTEWIPSAFISFWTTDLLSHLPLAILFAAFFLIGRPDQNRQTLLQWFLILLGALAGAFLTRVKLGGYDNVLLPAYAAIAILFGLGLHELLKITDQFQSDYKTRAKVLIHLACLSQLVILFYNPYAQLPTNADRKAGNQLVQLIAGVKGDVFLVDHGYISTLAGKKTYAQHSAIWDILRGNQQTPGRTLLEEDLTNAIRHQAFDMIILDSDWNYCCKEIDKYYSKTGVVFQDETVFYPVTGGEKRPTYIYVPKKLK